ncbi:MAG: hypothetical protein ACI89L_000744 [Phycisphaerales bacterium]|jgi:hypothetical protein
MRSVLSVAALVGLASGSAAIGQDAVFSHDLQTSGPLQGFGWFSHSETRPNKNYLRADDFELSADASIGSVEWWGQSTNDFETSLANFDSFTVAMYESRVTGAGELRPKRAPMLSETFTLGEFASESTGRFGQDGGAEHHFTASLTTPFDLQGGVTYFFSVGAGMVDTGLDAFQWSDSIFYNGYGGSWSYTDATWLMQQDTDSAFTLFTVPTPSGFGVLSAGLLVVSRRRR